jgi:hypothetical protein
LKRKIYHFQNLNHFSNSLSVSQFIPYILSQSLIIDSFCDEEQAFYHSGLIPIIFSTKRYNKSSDIMKLVKKDSIEYNFLKHFPNSFRKSNNFSETFKQSFPKFLHHFMRYIWTHEFLYELIIIHQRLDFQYPTFHLGKQGLGKTEIITLLVNFLSL